MAGSKANSERATEAVGCLEEGGNLRVVRWHRDDRGGARCVELAAGAAADGGGATDGGGGGGSATAEDMFGAASGFVAEYLHARGNQLSTSST